MTVRLLGIAQFLLLAAAGLVLFQFWTDLHSPTDPAQTAPPPDSGPQTPSPKPHPFNQNDLQAITTRDLFGTDAEQMPTDDIPIALERMARTDLEIKLWGTIAGDADSAVSYAVIETPRLKTQRLYRTGDRIEDATLKRILRQKVVLSRAGRDEVLSMEKPQTASARIRRPPVRRPASDRHADRPATSAPAVPPPAPPGRQPPSPERPVHLSAEMLTPVVELLEAEAGDLFAVAAADADGDGGVRVLAGKHGTVLRQLGLHNGDVIVRVDGAPVVDAADVVNLFHDMSEGEEVTVTVRRGRRERNLRYLLP